MGGWTRWAGAIWTLVRTDFKVRYHGTVGGFLWALLKPLSMFVVLMAVFSLIFSSDRHYTLNLVVGLFIWDFFVESTKVGITSLHAKGYLVSKTRFPRWIIVATAPSNAIVTLTVFTLALLTLLTALGRAPSLMATGLLALYLFQYLLMAIGISLAGSVLFLRYRDLNQVWEVVTQVGFFVAPIIYPLAILPERFHFYLYLWPPTAVIQFARLVLVEGKTPTPTAHLLLTAMTLGILMVGTLIFRRLAPTVAEKL
jgi:lipopolysaccharide transport system permease protein